MEIFIKLDKRVLSINFPLLREIYVYRDGAIEMNYLTGSVHGMVQFFLFEKTFDAVSGLMRWYFSMKYLLNTWVRN